MEASKAEAYMWASVRLSSHKVVIDMLLLDKQQALVIKVTAVGFEPTQFSLVELESTPLDHSGKLSLRGIWHLTLHT